MRVGNISHSLVGRYKVAFFVITQSEHWPINFSILAAFVKLPPQK